MLSHFRSMENLRYIEVSAKENISITEIFQTFLDLSGFPGLGNAQNRFPSRENSLKKLGSRVSAPLKQSTFLSPVSSGRFPSVDQQPGFSNSTAAEAEDNLSDSLVDKLLTRHGSFRQGARKLTLKMKQLTVRDEEQLQQIDSEPECKIA